MADVNFTVHDNSKMVLSEFQRKIENGWEAIGMTAETHAKKDCPVDTGRLRNSITYATKSHSGFTYNYKDDDDNPYSYNVGNVNDKGGVYIGTNVEYAEPVETRNVAHKVGKAHFLRDAATQHPDEYRNIMKASLES